MGVLDRFLNAMKLNDNDGFDDDDFLDDEMDDFEEAVSYTHLCTAKCGCTEQLSEVCDDYDRKRYF